MDRLTLHETLFSVCVSIVIFNGQRNETVCWAEGKYHNQSNQTIAKNICLHILLQISFFLITLSKTSGWCEMVTAPTNEAKLKMIYLLWRWNAFYSQFDFNWKRGKKIHTFSIANVNVACYKWFTIVCLNVVLVLVSQRELIARTAPWVYGRESMCLLKLKFST